jgi:hypothetical protein
MTFGGNGRPARLSGCFLHAQCRLGRLICFYAVVLEPINVPARPITGHRPAAGRTGLAGHIDPLQVTRERIGTPVDRKARPKT